MLSIRVHLPFTYLLQHELKRLVTNLSSLYRLTLGLIMLGFKGFGFLIALVYNFFSTLSALKEFVLVYAWPYIPCMGKRPEDKLHDVIRQVMLQVRLPVFLSFSHTSQSHTAHG